ncbi:hypothetical protein NT6N_09750 [Oceaniferula spumae]|uniref:Tetratricopeptide repeat protein n=1 Tax=Oceaniferula spumae TaxID=2979115 RepID=A0AAT9FIU6_9BACT
MQPRFLTLSLISASLVSPLTAQIETLPPEIQARLQAQIEASRAGRVVAKAPAQDGKSASDPAKLRLDLLKKLTIDRTNAGILQSRLQATRKPAEEPLEKPATPASPAQVELAKIKKDIEQLQLNLNLGNWRKAGEYLATLKENEIQIVYDRILQQLASPVNVVPRPELAAAGAKPHRQKQYLRASDVLAVSNLSPKAPDKDSLSKLSQLLKNSDTPPKEFFNALKNSSRYFGTKDAESSLLTARFLMDAGHLDEAKPYLPSLAESKNSNDFAALNLIARWHAQAHRADEGHEHLPLAWETSLDLVGNKKAPFDARAEALYRALGLVPDLEGEAGRDWLHKTFAGADGEGFEILTTIGTLAAQVHQHPSASYRLEQIKLQRAAAQALLSTPGIDPKPWQEILTLYARNWLYEAEHTNKYDSATSMRPTMSMDTFGNPYYMRTSYTQSMVGRSVNGQKVVPAIDTGDILREGPDARWIALLDEPVKIQTLTLTARLYLKVKEHKKALPLLETLASDNPDDAEELCRELVRVWAENNNPNQKNQYRSSYYYFSGYNQRAETIPLTRSKQERNLLELAKLIKKIRAFNLDESFDKEFADAFIQCHSKAEVWRVESLETVFGDLEKLDAKIAASLLRRMRGNLANLWPNPKLQEEAETKRKDKELQAQVLKGYAAASDLCENVLKHHPGDWALQVQKSALIYEESNYRATLGSHPEHSANKRLGLNGLASACEAYSATLPLEDKKDESDEAFTTWFYAALGSPDLSALKSHHQPVPSEFAKIKEALESLPESCRKRHMDLFAKTLNTRLANVGADLKYRFLESALPITGDHERISDATKIFQYYQDLVTEIQLDAHIDGSDRINASVPFGLFVNLRHTREIERESGGFQRYLINQSNSQFAYNYGRPTEDYRDKFEKSARAALEEHFEVVSLTFHHSKVQSRTDSEPGWSVTPYAYFLLKPKGPEIDSIPPMKIDLDFLDTSGYVVLPITSAAIPIDASGKGDPRPHRNLKVTMTLDEREAEKENKIALEIKATAHGLVPPLDRILDLNIDGFDVSTEGDNELLVAELDVETDDGAPISTREWRLILTPQSDHLPKSFAFPVLQKDLNLAEEDALTLQQYDDVDLIPSSSEVTLGAGSKSGFNAWLLLLAVPVLALVYWLISKNNKDPEAEVLAGPQLPNTLTPVTAIAFLKRVHQNASLDETIERELMKEIESLEARSFSSDSNPPSQEELEKITAHWQQRATQKRAA